MEILGLPCLARGFHSCVSQPVATSGNTFRWRLVGWMVQIAESELKRWSCQGRVFPASPPTVRLCTFYELRKIPFKKTTSMLPDEHILVLTSCRRTLGFDRRLLCLVFTWHFIENTLSLRESISGQVKHHLLRGRAKHRKNRWYCASSKLVPALPRTTTSSTTRGRSFVRADLELGLK